MVNRNVTLMLVGLDNSGKTTTAQGLVGGSLENVTPTLGFCPLDLTYRGCRIKLFDLGGSSKIRPVWHNYFDQIHGLIFVIDSSDQRIEECKKVLNQLLTHKKIAGKPILILANKQDVENSYDDIDLVELLQIERFVNAAKCPTRIDSCSAYRIKNKRPDKAISDGFRWLIDTVVLNYDQLNKRVEKDEEKQRKTFVEEREKRIKKINQEKESYLNNLENGGKNESNLTNLENESDLGRRNESNLNSEYEGENESSLVNRKVESSLVDQEEENNFDNQEDENSLVDLENRNSLVDIENENSLVDLENGSSLVDLESKNNFKTLQNNGNFVKNELSNERNASEIIRNDENIKSSGAENILSHEIEPGKILSYKGGKTEEDSNVLSERSQEFSMNKNYNSTLSPKIINVAPVSDEVKLNEFETSSVRFENKPVRLKKNFVRFKNISVESENVESYDDKNGQKDRNFDDNTDKFTTSTSLLDNRINGHDFTGVLPSVDTPIKGKEPVLDKDTIVEKEIKNLAPEEENLSFKIETESEKKNFSPKIEIFESENKNLNSKIVNLDSKNENSKEHQILNDTYNKKLNGFETSKYYFQNNHLELESKGSKQRESECVPMDSDEENFEVIEHKSEPIEHSHEGVKQDSIESNLKKVEHNFIHESLEPKIELLTAGIKDQIELEAASTKKHKRGYFLKKNKTAPS